MSQVPPWYLRTGDSEFYQYVEFQFMAPILGVKIHPSSLVWFVAIFKTWIRFFIQSYTLNPANAYEKINRFLSDFNQQTLIRYQVHYHHSSAGNIEINKTMEASRLRGNTQAVGRRGTHWLQHNVQKGAWNRKWSVLFERSEKGYTEEVIFELQFKGWMGFSWMENGQEEGNSRERKRQLTREHKPFFFFGRNMK